ncbi:unnamed protein product, partial [Allacma fusca]
NWLEKDGFKLVESDGKRGIEIPIPEEEEEDEEETDYPQEEYCNETVSYDYPCSTEEDNWD